MALSPAREVFGDPLAPYLLVGVGSQLGGLALDPVAALLQSRMAIKWLMLGLAQELIPSCSRCEISALLCSQKRQAGKGRFFSDHWVNLKLAAVHTVPTKGESLRGRVFLFGAAFNQRLHMASGTDVLQGLWWGCEVASERRGEPAGGFVADTCCRTEA